MTDFQFSPYVPIQLIPVERSNGTPTGTSRLETQMPGELQFVPQLTPREPLLIFPLKSAGEIVQLVKKGVDEPPESQESESVLNKTAAHVSESQ